MKAEIKYFHSPDVPDLENFTPEIKDDFSFLLQIIVGEKGRDGEESFDVFVCTPRWLINNNSKEAIIYGRHYLIVFEFDYRKITEELTQYVESIEAQDWDSIAEQIGRIGKWEFEDYKE
jgi:hypothetical protein